MNFGKEKVDPTNRTETNIILRKNKLLQEL